MHWRGPRNTRRTSRRLLWQRHEMGPPRALRSNPDLVPFLRLRIADIETRLVDLTNNNRPIVESRRAIAQERP